MAAVTPCGAYGLSITTCPRAGGSIVTVTVDPIVTMNGTLYPPCSPQPAGSAVASFLPLKMTSGPTARSPGCGCCGGGGPAKDSSPQEKSCGLPGPPVGPVTGAVAGAAW